MSLITTGDFKTSKGDKRNYLTGIVYMAPSNIVIGINVCKFASAGCKKACLYTAGHGAFSNVQAARIKRTELFRDDINEFMDTITMEIIKLNKKATRKGTSLAIRLNGTSDICWEKIRSRLTNKNIFETFPTIQFYDYTKDHTRLDALKGKWGNYHLTYSVSETKASEKHALRLLPLGVNCAVVFKELPTKYLGHKVINGDLDDLRFLDDKGVVVGLKAKGQARKDQSGFVKVAV